MLVGTPSRAGRGRSERYSLQTGYRLVASEAINGKENE
jgi:hypothetical protein